MKLVSVVFVRRFPKQDMRRTQFVFEDRIRLFKGMEGQVFNLPANSPPNVARFLLSANNANLIVSDNAVQLQMNFNVADDGAQFQWDEQLSIAENLDETLDSIFSKKEGRWYSGVVATLQADIGEPGFSLPALSNEIFKNPVQSVIGTLSASIAVRRGELNYGVEVNQFKQFTQMAFVGQPLFFDDEFDKPTGEGVQVKLDVNSKPQKSRSPSRSNLKEIVVGLKRLVSGEVETFLSPNRLSILAGAFENAR